jgi:hypothetical protein
MVCKGKVSGGVVVLDRPGVLPEGTLVEVRPARAKAAALKGPTLSEKLLRLAGKAKGLPPDLALNHDHYLHGRPKR